MFVVRNVSERKHHYMVGQRSVARDAGSVAAHVTRRGKELQNIGPVCEVHVPGLDSTLLTDRRGGSIWGNEWVV